MAKADAALCAASMLALSDPRAASAVETFRRAQTEQVLSQPDPRSP